MRLIVWLLAALLTAAVIAPPAADATVMRRPGASGATAAKVVPTPERSAIVIGNANYSAGGVVLPAAVNDASGIARQLRAEGFLVEYGENLTGEAMRGALQRFYAGIKPGSLGLIYFAGYGVSSDQTGYLLPTDARIDAEADIAAKGVALQAIVDEMHHRGARFKVALIDASRDNPFERKFRPRALGLAPLKLPPDSLAMYAHQPNATLKDGAADTSVFADHLIGGIGTPDIAAEDALLRVRAEIMRATSGAQSPWVSISTQDDFTFHPSPSPVPEKQAAGEPAPAQPTAQADPASDPMCKIAEPGPQELAKNPRIRKLSERIAINPTDRDTLSIRARLYASIGAYSMALADFDSVIKQSGGGPETFNDRCYVRAVLGDLPAAIDDCNEALRQKPDFTDALDSRGLARLKSGQPQRAIEDFDAALKLNDLLPTTLYARGVAKLQLGAAAQAEADMRAAIKLDSLAGDEIAKFGIADPHPEWGLSGYVRINDAGEISVTNGHALSDGTIADTRTDYTPQDPRYDEMVRHLCGLKPGERKRFRPWR